MPVELRQLRAMGLAAWQLHVAGATRRAQTQGEIDVIRDVRNAQRQTRAAIVGLREGLRSVLAATLLRRRCFNARRCRFASTSKRSRATTTTSLRHWF